MLSKYSALALTAVCGLGCQNKTPDFSTSSRASITDPDLTITSLQGPPSVDAGSSFTVQARVCNHSGYFANSTDLQLSFSTDQALDPLDTLAGFGWVSALQPGQCENVDIFANAPFGGPTAQYLAAEVDPFNNQPESNEGNNVTFGAVTGIGNGPDFIITDISAPPVANGAFEATVTVCNQGTSFASGTDVAIYASQDTIIDPMAMVNPDFPLGAVWIPFMNAGECRAETVQLFSGPIGEYYVGAIVDEYSSVVELIESNNTYVGSIMGFGNGPDLVVQLLSAPPSADGMFTVDVHLCNQGNAPAPGADILVYASSDEVITPLPAPNADYLVGGAFSSFLNPGECSILAVPAYSGMPGAFFLGTIIDDANVIAELLESNNTHVGGLIGFGQGPDLIVSNISAPPSATNNFDAEVTVCNQGTTGASADVTLYASQDTTITPIGAQPSGPDMPIGGSSIPWLQEGTCQTVTVPAYAMGQGPWYLGAIVDEYDTTPELIETNNSFTGDLIGFGWGSDLVVSAVSGPASADGAFNVEVTTCNQGTSASNPSDVTVYLSSDKIITPATGPNPGPDFPTAWSPVPGLQPGQCNTGLAYGSAGPMGAFYLGAYVDEQNTEMELIESNNAFTGELIGIGYGPDLIVSAIAAPPSADGPFLVTVTACNQGTAASSGSDLTVYASADQIITPYTGQPYIVDYPLANIYIMPLQPGECRPETTTAYPAMNGALYLAAYIDEINGQVELIESNNSFVGALTGFGPGADLVVSDISAPASADGQFSFSVTVCNQGTTPSSSSDVTLYSSEDEVISPMLNAMGPDMPLAWVPVASLLAGECRVELGIAYAPATGAYYLGAVVDEQNVLPELIESNNILLGNQIGFGYGPDLIAGTMSEIPFVMPGAPTDFTVEICNQGTAPSSSTDAVLLASQDEILDEVGPNPDWMVGYTPVPGLAPGACHVAVINGYSPNLEGSYSVGLVVDPASTVQELIESNNRQVSFVLDVAYVFCGNGSLDQAAEQCDDGNFDSGDGCDAQCNIEQLPWQQLASGTLRTNVNWNYAMGYHFTPLLDGQINALGGYFNGTKTVRLFERNTGTLLAETQATAANTWGYGSIDPVLVSAGTSYSVVVYLAGSGGSYRYGAGSMPQYVADIQIEGTTWTHTGSNPDARPTNNYTYGYMFGQADIAFVPLLP